MVLYSRWVKENVVQCADTIIDPFSGDRQGDETERGIEENSFGNWKWGGALHSHQVKSQSSIFTYCVFREIAILKELNHPAVVKLLDVDVAEKKLFLVFEHLDKVPLTVGVICYC